MTDKLIEICDAKRKYVSQQKRLLTLDQLEQQIKIVSPLRDFENALRQRKTAGQFGLIAEIKRASPSAGLLRENLDPAELARAYEAGGATCLSVLTDEPYFHGKNSDLIAARNACTLPVLRKDFILDPWQVAESRALSADCILLIMAALSDAMANEIHAAATQYKLAMLVEVHDAAELERALRLPNTMIGINNRNLRTLKTDLRTSENLSAFVPLERFMVSESGISNSADLHHLNQFGIHAFLIGESLLKQNNLIEATRAILA